MCIHSYVWKNVPLEITSYDANLGTFFIANLNII